MNAQTKAESLVMTSERRRYAFMRFSLSGVIFTSLGPTLFWFLYPVGPYLAVASTEIVIHTMRYFTFRHLIFPHKKGYRVSPVRYIVSALPVTLSSFVCVGLLKDVLNRTALTLCTALLSVIIGFLWSKFVYTRDF